MAWGNITIVKGADDVDGNEQFYIVRHDPSLNATQPGYIQERKGPFREAVIRDFLQTFGHRTHDLDEMFQNARARHKP